VLLAVLAAIAIAFVAYAVISPLVFESDLTATIATLGIGLIAQGATLLIFGADIVSLDLPVPRFSLSVLGLLITGYDLTVVVEHDMDLVMSICDRIYVMNFGAFVACGSPDDVRNDEDVVRIYLGSDDD
jgi:ABC-type uncharacterized transport system ATPase subunit